MDLKKAHIRGYRSLADVDLELRPINVFFGQNAAGKSSFLDAIWFVRDCAVRGVEEATEVDAKIQIMKWWTPAGAMSFPAR